MTQKYSCDGNPRSIEFFIPGYPRPAGWKAADVAGPKVKHWRKKVKDAAIKAQKKFGKINGPVRVTYKFIIPTDYHDPYVDRIVIIGFLEGG